MSCIAARRICPRGEERRHPWRIGDGILTENWHAADTFMGGCRRFGPLATNDSVDAPNMVCVPNCYGAYVYLFAPSVNYFPACPPV